MTKKLVAWMMLASFNMNIVFPGRAAALEPQHARALQQAFLIYSESKTVGDFLIAVKPSLSGEDYAHLNSRLHKEKGEALPKAELTGDRIELSASGQHHIAQFNDLNAMSFNINGKPVSYDVDLSMAENLARIKKSVGPSASVTDYIVSSAYADGGASILIIAIIVLLAAAGVRMIWKMANKTALDRCEEWKTRLRKDRKVTENEKSGLNVQYGFLATRVLVTCSPDETNEKCREFKKSERCLKEALDMMKVEQQAYGGSKIPQAVGGTTPIDTNQGSADAL